MSRKPFFMLAAMGGLVAALAACASSTPALDGKFGMAIDAMHRTQVIDAEAGKKADAETHPGIDGVAAAGAMERYRASFKNPPEPVNVFNIGVGSSSGGH
jgi:hypothetical protein